MKVSETPSAYFPKSLKKMLKSSDYADAAAKLRGVAGELMFEVVGVKLPDGFKIVARQVDTAGKVIDFQLRDAANQLAKLEVKAWNAERWAAEIANNAKSKRLRGAFKRMTEQLKAAKSSGQKVYLGVSDAVGASEERLVRILEREGLNDVTLVKFPETALKETASKLRKGLGLAAATAAVGADQIAKATDDD